MRPDGAERRYEQFLLGYVTRMHDLARAQVLPAYAQAFATLQASAPPPPPARADDDDERAVENLYRTLRAVRIEWRREVPDGRLEQAATEAGREAAEVSRENLSRTFQAVLALQPLQTERGVATQLALFRRQNVELIRSLDSRFFDELDGLVGRALQAGRRPEVLAEEIAQRYQVSRSRAQLIARDQLGKLSGQMDRLRQQEAGLTRYIWRTAKDARVRDSHQPREGKVYSWDLPPADGHPGTPVRCRCYAEPVLEDVLQGREETPPPSAGPVASPEREVSPAPVGSHTNLLPRSVAGVTDRQWLDEANQAVDELPLGVRLRLNSEGVTANLGESVDQIDPEHADDHPRGYPPGATFRNVPSWYTRTRTTRSINLVRRFVDSDGRLVENLETIREQVAHEVGHFLAERLLLVPELRRTYAEEAGEALQDGLARGLLSYVLQSDDPRNPAAPPGRAGLSELIAEATALTLVGSATGFSAAETLILVGAFTKSLAFIETFIKNIR